MSYLRVCMVYVFLDVLWCFFFKQKTAYEMRISDWSSDVCSSDLLGRLVEKEKIDAQARDAALERIEPIDGVVGMSTCGLVIEAATEREEIKRSIFEAVGKVLGHQAVLASNTSSIPITRLAPAAPGPKRLLRSEERRLGKACVLTCIYRGVSAN